MKGKRLTLYLVLIAAFTAVNFLITFLLPIPGFFGVGYINFGDAVIMISSCILGPVGGMVVGGIGSMLADIMAGYAVYAPFTLVIKGVEGMLCGVLYLRALRVIKSGFWRRLISMLIAGAWMIVGYFFADWIIYGSIVTAAASNFVGGPVQAIVSVVVAMIALPKAHDLFGLQSPRDRE